MATLQPEVTVGINRELQGCSVVVTPAVWRQLGDVHSNDNIRLTGFLKDRSQIKLVCPVAVALDENDQSPYKIHRREYGSTSPAPKQAKAIVLKLEIGEGLARLAGITGQLEGTVWSFAIIPASETRKLSEIRLAFDLLPTNAERQLPSEQSIRHQFLGLTVEDGDILNILLKDGSIVPCQSVVAEGDAGIVTSSTRVVLDIGSQKAPNPLLTSIQQDITSVLDLLAVYVKYIGNTNEESSLPLPVALPHKILLHGPSGHGKRSLVEVVASHTGLPLVKVTPADVSTRAMQTTQPIAALVSEARQKGTCILMFEDIDILLAEDESAELQSQVHIINQFKEALRPFDWTGVLFVATASELELLPLPIRRLFDKELPMESLSTHDRRALLKFFVHSRAEALGLSTSVSDGELDSLADSCHGFSPADLEAFVRNATLKASIKSTTQDDTPLDASLMKTQKAETKPINVQRFAPSVPNVRWNDIGGLKEVKDKLKQATVWLYNHQETLQRLGIRAPRGVLLYGPPGTGKTLLAKAVATESSANFISVNIGEIVKAEVGESEKTIADIFRSARRCAPSIIFFDEFQALFGNRGTATHYEKSMISQLLLEMDGVESTKDVVIIAATNRPDFIDTSFLRPGRFDSLIYIPPPDSEARKSILQMILKSMKVASSNEDGWLDRIVARTSRFTGADMRSLCMKAGLHSIKRDNQGITESDFLTVLGEISPTVTFDMEQQYKDFSSR